jgi:anti-sigma regulatory factor (Ser/Thr protein kinase)
MRKSFDRDVAALEEIFHFTDEFASAEQLGKSASFAMNLAIEELFTNIVKYAADNGNDISIDLNVAGEDLIIKISDFDVEEFDVTDVAKVDVDGPLKDRGIGGIGLHLVRNMVDKITYEYRDRTARITLVKHLGDGDVRNQGGG